jgi:hypothetical protein
MFVEAFRNAIVLVPLFMSGSFEGSEFCGDTIAFFYDVQASVPVVDLCQKTHCRSDLSSTRWRAVVSF